MLKTLRARWQQGYRTMRYPDGPPPALPERMAGRPQLDASRCPPGCNRCQEACPTQAVQAGAAGRPLRLDMGRCLFCRDCEDACTGGALRFTGEFRLGASRREDLVVCSAPTPAGISAPPAAGTPATEIPELPRIQLDAALRGVLGRSLKLRQVSAGGCNACEADTNVLGTVAWDLGRFGIQFVASPRHADGLLVTGPVTDNMRLALEKTYQAVAAPKLVIAVGACAISGGLYADHEETHAGAGSVIPVDAYVPGCPPHPLTILHALLAILGRVS